jgi:hypothetical protein
MAYFAGTNPIIPHHVMGLVPAKYPIRDASMASLELPLSLSRVCVFITAGPSTKLFAWGDLGGHVLRETTSRGLCGLGCH